MLEECKQIMLDRYDIQEHGILEREEFVYNYRHSDDEPLFPKYTNLIDNMLLELNILEIYIPRLPPERKLKVFLCVKNIIEVIILIVYVELAMLWT